MVCQEKKYIDELSPQRPTDAEKPLEQKLKVEEPTTRADYSASHTQSVLAPFKLS